MNSRRKFLLQGGLATTGLIAAKPLETFARFGSAFGFFGNSITLLHTHSPQNVTANLKNGNAILLDTGTTDANANPELMKQLGYDAIPAGNMSSRIINKGSTRIAVISINRQDQSGDIVKQLSEVATKLKEERGCNLVVCLSDLGYQDKKNNDLLIAGQSKNIDVIIGSQSCADNIHLPAVVLNKDKQEVVINNSGHKEVAVGKIEIGFDSNGKKKSIRFGNIFTGAQTKLPKAPIA